MDEWRVGLDALGLDLSTVFSGADGGFYGVHDARRHGRRPHVRRFAQNIGRSRNSAGSPGPALRPGRDHPRRIPADAQGSGMVRKE